MRFTITSSTLALLTSCTNVCSLIIQPQSRHLKSLNLSPLRLTKTAFIGARIEGTKHNHGFRLSAKSPKDEEDEKDDGMQSAFDALEKLSSNDIDISAEVVPDGSFFAERMKKLEQSEDDLKAKANDPSSASPEEVKLYKDMYAELSGGEEAIVGDILSELGGNVDVETPSPTSAAPVEDLPEDADGIGEGMSEQDKDELMKVAINEALAEAKESVPEEIASSDEMGFSDPNSITKDEVLMREINALFDKANDELIASVEEIRKEQAEQAKVDEASRTARLAEDAERLAEAEGSVTSLITKVNREAEEVEKAIKELDEAKSKLKDDSLLQVADFRNLNVVKQGTIAGFLLFTIRAATDLVQIGGVDGEAHAALAAGQAGIAVVCAILFFVL